MARGKDLTAEQIEKIAALLRTDMTTTEICTRMGVSRAAVHSINRQRGIREYGGKHSNWRTK